MGGGGNLKFSHVVPKFFSERRYKKCIKTARSSKGEGVIKIQKKFLLIDVMSYNF